MRPRTAAALNYAQRCLVTVFLLVLFVEGVRFCIGGMDEIVSQLRMPAGYLYLVVPLCACLSLVVYLGYLLRWLPGSEDKIV